jgi:hypothetical protein
MATTETTEAPPVGINALHSVAQANVYRMNVTFEGEVQGHEIAVIAPSPEEAKTLVVEELNGVVGVGGPVLAVENVYLIYEPPEPPPEVQQAKASKSQAHPDDAPRHPGKK